MQVKHILQSFSKTALYFSTIMLIIIIHPTLTAFCLAAISRLNAVQKVKVQCKVMYTLKLLNLPATIATAFNAEINLIVLNLAS